MEGKRILNALPEALKNLIADSYGSVESFYDNVFNASADYFIAIVVKKDKEKEKALDEYRFITAMKLEAMAEKVGIKDFDGFDIYDAISGDFDELYIKINYGSRPSKA